MKPPEVRRAERLHVEADIRSAASTACARRSRSSTADVSTGSSSKTIERDPAVTRVRPRRQRGADVDEPDPEPVEEPDGAAASAREEEEERVVDRQQPGGDVGHPVDVEEVAPDLAVGRGVDADRLDDAQRAGSRRRSATWLVAVDRIAGRLAVVLEHARFNGPRAAAPELASNRMRSSHHSRRRARHAGRSPR